MFPGMGNVDPKKMQQLMKKLNMNVKGIDAEEVIIRCKDKDIRITRPEIMVTNMMGRDVYQISGQVSESSKGANEDDIKMVMEQTGKDRETVARKLEELNNDLARAIMELKEK
ncbi:MAG: Nascent polypeptide-associated complex protein [Candidatus Aenigmarchaeota archaeon]|nr:Nascent polypeptide-associated complex protein [Candidatus Aenigmarchaeota archaeon]